MNAWSPLVKWAAEGRVMHFDADARIAVTRLAAAPVELDGRLIGVLSVARQEGLDRGREHLKAWLPRHAAQVGRLVSLFELRREYSRHMRHSQALLSAANNVQGHKSQETLSRAICETALQVSSASDAALIRWRADSGRGWVQYATAGFKHKAPYPLSDDSLTAQALAEGMPLMLEDVGKTVGSAPLFFERDGGWPKGTLAILPLKLNERVIGGIVVASEIPGALPREESRNVALLGALASTSLEILWEMEEVSRRARTDALTGLANRHTFDEQLEQMLAHADRFGHSVSLIVADVDFFKEVNDKWGHEAGDQVLKSIAVTLTEGIRAVDVCARFGGEELAILLPQTSLQGAVELADRLRRAVAARPIPVEAGEIKVTVSCGVACYPEGVLTKEALFAAADHAMYDAKNAGRNCVKAAVPKPIGMVR
jgi:diguanylate cyclase (GGDEF)-like protein